MAKPSKKTAKRIGKKASKKPAAGRFKFRDGNDVEHDAPLPTQARHQRGDHEGDATFSAGSKTTEGFVVTMHDEPCSDLDRYLTTIAMNEVDRRVQNASMDDTLEATAFLREHLVRLGVCGG